MKSLTDVVSGSGLSGYAEIALIIFFGVFVAIALRLMLSKSRAYSDAARLPLEDEVSHVKR
jgi:cbb3-type cytochrome oxidase subunit 3